MAQDGNVEVGTLCPEAYYISLAVFLGLSHPLGKLFKHLLDGVAVAIGNLIFEFLGLIAPPLDRLAVEVETIHDARAQIDTGIKGGDILYKQFVGIGGMSIPRHGRHLHHGSIRSE